MNRVRLVFHPCWSLWKLRQCSPCGGVVVIVAYVLYRPVVEYYALEYVHRAYLLMVNKHI